ncbi:MAG TPA: pantetheine-phosphate adenylyltransferase [bacterium]|nr:pantetheine-phosphate adenylyltransferase [bacterium]
MPKKIGLYPGSFDPVTNGHLDIAERAAGLCDVLYMAVVANPSKNVLFSIEERVELLRKTTKHLPKIKVSSFEGLLVDYAKEIKANFIFRGLRAVSDFEHEFQMALINRSLHKKVEVLFLVPNEKFIFISSSAIKEVAKLGGDVKDFVPAAVERSLRERLGRK